MSNLLDVKINSPEKIIWEGNADWVSSVNLSGPFDILPFHANFITIIENQSIKIRSEGKITEYSYSRAVLYTHSNKVSIYINI
jgi:F0F1-type ATP synthase epsilon subunit